MPQGIRSDQTQTSAESAFRLDTTLRLDSQAEGIDSGEQTFPSAETSGGMSLSKGPPPSDLWKLVKDAPTPTVLTVGHSTRTIEEFLRLLKAHGATCVVDVRSVPRSRHNPQFNRDTLPASLAAANIAYNHLGGLGGLRRPKPDSINTGWKNASFRGYADYMQTPEFEASLARLIEIARKECVAIMCAEAVPWRCHRSLIADALVVRGIPTEHILSETRRDSHTLRSFVKRSGRHITYPTQDAGPELF